MKKLSKIAVASAVSILFSQLVSALPDNYEPSDFSVIALKNCAVVSDKKMNSEQFDSYQSLKQQEQKMHELEKPIQALDLKINTYTTEIEELTKLAIQETDEALHIDKTRLKLQTDVVEEFNQFMSQHQKKFDALGQQGKVIGQYAEVFETAIKSSLEGVDYDQIQVLTPDSEQTQPSCDSRVRVRFI